MPYSGADPSKDFVRRGNEIYERSVRSQVESGHVGEFVAIDIDSGAWALHADDFAATEQLLATHPNARTWLVRVGSSAAYKIGGAIKSAFQTVLIGNP